MSEIYEVSGEDFDFGFGGIQRAMGGVETAKWNDREVEVKKAEEAKIPSDFVKLNKSPHLNHPDVAYGSCSLTKRHENSQNDKATAVVYQRVNGLKPLGNSSPGGGASARGEITVKWGGNDGPKTSVGVSAEAHDRKGNNTGVSYKYEPTDKDPHTIKVSGETKQEFNQ